MNIKKATLLTILTAIGIGLVSCAFKLKDYNFSKITKPVIAESYIEEIQESNKSRTHTRAVNKTISNLTNKTLTFNYNPTIQQSATYNIYFQTSTGEFDGLRLGTDTNEYGVFYYIDYLWNNNTNAIYYYSPGANYTSWLSNPAMSITITGGQDVTNPNLISWLIANSNLNTTEQIADIENGNFVSLQQLMLKILTLPFTFISQAFNVTLWPNTPYAFNISNFILSLIAISAILFIIKLFTSGFSVIGNYNSNIQQNKLTKAKIAETKSKTNLNNRTDPNKKVIKRE